MSVTSVSRRFEWLPVVLAAVAFVGCFAAFIWQLFIYQKDVRAWSEADLKSRAELTASTLAEPLRTLDFKAIQKVANQLKADGLRLRITEGHFFVSEGDGLNGFFDTCGEPYPADIPCIFKVARTDNFFVGVGRPSFQMLLPFLGALLVIVLAALAGILGVLLFFFVTYRQRVRIRELARLEKFRREFIADVSHEIKTPLSGILGAVDLMGEESKSEVAIERSEIAEGLREQRKVLLSLIRKESKRLNGLVQSILDLARLEREGDVLNLAEADLGELVRGLAEKFKVEFRGGDVSSPRFLVRCDPQLIEQAVSNLIGNAVRHSGSEEIIVTVGCDERMARVVVEDHGVGIPSEHAARIFERFHRVDPARSAETGGAGLGLAIVRRIARLHGGDVAFSDVQPHGSRFTLSFLRK